MKQDRRTLQVLFGDKVVGTLGLARRMGEIIVKASVKRKKPEIAYQRCWMSIYNKKDES